jgi:hypothetical protein
LPPGAGLRALVAPRRRSVHDRGGWPAGRWPGKGIPPPGKRGSFGTPPQPPVTHGSQSSSTGEGYGKAPNASVADLIAFRPRPHLFEGERTGTEREGVRMPEGISLTSLRYYPGFSHPVCGRMAKATCQLNDLLRVVTHAATPNLSFSMYR